MKYTERCTKCQTETEGRRGFHYVLVDAKEGKKLFRWGWAFDCQDDGCHAKWYTQNPDCPNCGAELQKNSTQTDDMSGERFVEEWGCISCLKRFDIDLDRVEEET